MPQPTKPIKTANGCRPAQLIGLWLMDPTTLERYRQQAVGVNLAELAEQYAAEWGTFDFDQFAGIGGAGNVDRDARPYKVHNGVAYFAINGPTTKYPTSFQRLFGGTSTVMLERSVRLAMADPEVKGGMMLVEDAPGGTVAGSHELWTALRAFGKAKPLHVHASDLMASASYLYGCAGQRLTANATAHVGNIGVRTALVDTSKKFEKEGVTVVPFTTGAFKSFGMDGVEVTEEHRREMQKMVDQLGDMFFGCVAEARGLTKEQIKAMEARVYMGAEAVQMKLIDGVCSREEAVASLHKQLAAPNSGRGGPTPNPARRSASMDLIAQLQQALGDANLSEDGAVARVRQLVSLQQRNTELQQQLDALRASSPAMPAAEMVVDLAEVAEGKINNAVAAGNLPPVIAETLKATCGIGKGLKPNAFMFAKVPSLDGQRPVDVVLKMHADAKGQQAADVPATGSQSTIQRIERNVPGSESAADLAKIEAQADADVKRFKAERGIFT